MALGKQQTECGVTAAVSGPNGVTLAADLRGPKIRVSVFDSAPGHHLNQYFKS
jgi:hypothetical protein